MILSIIFTVHICIILYEKHTRQKWPFPKWLIYTGFVIHIMIGVSPIAPTIEDYSIEGIWIRRDAVYYTTWFFSFLIIAMVLNIYTCFKGFRLTQNKQKSKKLFLFITWIIPVNGILYILITWITPERFLPSISPHYIMVSLSLFILFGMYRFHLFPKYVQRYITMFNRSPISKFVLDENFNIIEVNEQTKRYFNMNFVGLNLMNLTKKYSYLENVQSVLKTLTEYKEIDNETITLPHFKTGKPIHLVIHANAIEENGELFYYVMFRDRTLEVEQEEKIRQLAYFDKLTGLPNRASFIEECEKLFNSEPNGALLLIDLNEFKQVNDKFGHAAGDYILQSVANVLERVAHNVHLPARLGGDEFVMYVRLDQLSITFDQFLIDLRNELQNEPVSYEGTPLQIIPSIGYAMKTSEKSLSELLHEADQKMYMDKLRIKQMKNANAPTTMKKRRTNKY